MKCEELLLLFNEYVDGTLDPAVCEGFEQHLTGCNPCQIVIDNIRGTITLYKEGRMYEVPQEFCGRLHETLRAKWKEMQRGHEGRKT